jgi:catechol 2,3-dioxygenase
MTHDTKTHGARLPPRDYGVAPAEFRLPDDTRLGAVHLQISDLARSRDYYTQVLGMRAIRQTPTVATLAAQGDDRPLIWLHAKPGLRAARRRGAFGLYHFAILLPDRAALGRFAAQLARTGTPVGMADHGVSEALYLTDPDGLGIEVYADRPRSAWRRQGREIAMTVDPLDLPNLVAAAGARAWEGLPPGSTIGHVHLHVGNLPKAEDFYHRALGFEKVAWSLPGALFLSAGGYHHHLGTNTWAPGPAAAEDEPRLLEWELIVPTREQAGAAAHSVAAAGYEVQEAADGWTLIDPWGTSLRLVAQLWGDR